MNDTQLYSEIAVKLQSVLPSGWKKLCLYADVSDDSYEMFYYVFPGDGSEPIQCYRLPQFYQITEESIDQVFSELAKALRSSKNMSGQAWTVFTFLLSEDGTMDAYYDYKDHSEDTFSYKREWKQKYVTQ